MLRVGLTGNIATGKSCASQKFAEMGAHVLDADMIAREVVANGMRAHKRIVEAFGKDILRVDGSIDRKKLGDIVFCDPIKRNLLNSLIHPEIGREIERKISELEQISQRGITIIEAALIVEAGSTDRYDRLVVVTCERSLQISRLIDRDGLTSEEAIARIDSQMPIEEKLKLADYRIDTSGTIKQTHDQVEDVYRDLLDQGIPVNDE